MLHKKTSIFKNAGLIVLFLFAVIACEKDIEDIGVDLVGNNVFKVGDTMLDVVAYNFRRDSSRVDNNDVNNLPGYLMGVNRDVNFGSLKTTFISQLFLPGFGANFGDNAVIDLVVLDIPYYATRDTVQYAVDPITGEEILDEDGNKIVTPSFVLDSVYGNQDLTYQVRVSELETFLNVLDPENPTKNKEYYSDRDYNISSELFYGNFKPNRNDTVLYVKRKYLDDNPSTVDDIDTVKAENAVPSMKFYLDKEYFKTHFIDQQDTPAFDSNDNFIHYFKGIFLESLGMDGTLINFPSNKGAMTIYYTNEVIRDEAADEDLNGNGITGEEGVLVKEKKNMKFGFAGVKSGRYVRDYSGSLAENSLFNPDRVNGDKQLFIQGASGSEAIVELFTPETLQQIRDKGWLVNEANLKLYIDKGTQTGRVPKQLFLYNYKYKSIIKDLKFGGFEILGGELVYDDDGEPDYYKFRMTSFISEILDAGDPKDPATIAIKTFNPTDVPDFQLLDSIVKDYSWIPKGVVIQGNQPVTNSKRLRLEIFYSK